MINAIFYFEGTNIWHFPQIICKRDAGLEASVQHWIEAVLGAKFIRPYDDELRDGVTLCNLMNKLSPGSVAKVNTSGSNFKMMENVNRYESCSNLSMLRVLKI